MDIIEILSNLKPKVLKYIAPLFFFFNIAMCIGSFLSGITFYFIVFLANTFILLDYIFKARKYWRKEDLKIPRRWRE